MFCPNCGTKNEDDALFCGNCGTKLSLEEFNQTLNEENKTVDLENEVSKENVTDNQQAVSENTNEVSQSVQVNQGFISYDSNQSGQTNQGFAPNGFNQNEQTNQGFVPNGFNQNTNQSYQPQPAKQFKFSKKILGAIIAVVVAIVAIVIFVNVGKAGVDYKKIAKKYVTAVEQCDWDTAYEYLNLPDSEFLTKDALEAAHSSDTGEKVTAITVVDSYSTAGNLKGNEYVTVTYSTPTTSANSVNLLLSQTDDKYLLFFKKYKVSTEDVVYTDARISVPKGLTLTVNGVEANSKYITSDTSSSDYLDTYIIPYVFAGSNTIKVSGDVIEDYETTINISYDEYSKSISYTDLTLTEETKNTLTSKAQSDLTTIAKAAYDNKSYDDIKNGLYVTDNDYNNEKDYDYLVDDFHPSYRTISSYEFSNIKTSLSSSTYSYDTDDGCPRIKVNISYTISGKYTTNYSNEEKSGSYSYSSYYIIYKYVDGEWLIDDLYLNYYFY